VVIPGVAKEAWLQICDSYKIPIDAKVLSLGGDQNRLFHISIPNCGQQVLRLSQPGSVTKQIESELMVLKHLSQTTTFKVPSPIADRRGQLSTTIYENGQPDSTPVAMFSFVTGEVLSKRIPSSDMMFRVGKILSQLDLALKHTDQALNSSPSKSRPKRDGEKIVHWSISQLIKHQGDYRFLHGKGPGRGLSPKIIEVADRLRHNYRRFKGILPHQLLHADANLTNLVFDGTRIGILDFDNMGYGPRIYELMAPIYSIYELELSDNIHISSNALSPLTEALLAGYGANIRLSDAELESIPLIQAIKLFGAMGWMVSRKDQSQSRRLLEQGGEARLKWISALLDMYEKKLMFGRFVRPKFWIDRFAKV
jgi:Ser/Thr protein kinase RdoA (MazF antagonist)